MSHGVARGVGGRGRAAARRHGCRAAADAPGSRHAESAERAAHATRRALSRLRGRARRDGRCQRRAGRRSCARGDRRARAMTRRVLRILALATLGAALGSCAPHLVSPPELSLETREARYTLALAARERAATAVEADVVAWAVLSGDRDLPGAQAKLLLATPDAFRLRVS